MRHEPLALGDTLLVIGPRKAIRRLQTTNTDLVAFNLPVELD